MTDNTAQTSEIQEAAIVLLCVFPGFKVFKGRMS